MKFQSGRLLRRLLLPVASLLLAAALPAQAQNFTLNFTDDSGDTAGVDANNTWVVFTGGAWDGTLGVGGANIDIYNGTNDAAYSISQIDAAGGFNITDIAAGRAYVFYGNDSLTNFENTTAVQPAAGGDYRYSFTEWNATNGVASPDISEIDQFGGSVRLDAYAYNGTGYALSNSVYNTIDNTGDAMRALAASTNFTSTSSAVITSGGNVVSFVGPTGNPTIESSAYLPNANTNFTTYLTALHAINSTAWISNNQSGQGHGLVPVTDIGGGNYLAGNATTSNYIAVYSFNATVDAGGNIIMNGSVTLTGAGSMTTGNTTVYNGLYMVVPAGSNLTTMIYSGTVTLPGTNNSPITFGNTSTSNITVNGNVTGSATWSSLNAYANAGYANTTITAADLNQINGNKGAYSLVAQLAFGDESEGLNTGIIGNTTFASESSGQWWASPANAYSNVTIGSGNYNAFGEVNFANSANTTYNISTGAVTGNVVGGAIYTGPYDDRFNSNLVSVPSLGEADVVLLPDGNMSTSYVFAVPEPATDALLGAGAVAIVAEFYRRRRKSRRAGLATARPAARHAGGTSGRG
jgi:hypothetical protein